MKFNNQNNTNPMMMNSFKQAPNPNIYAMNPQMNFDPMSNFF